MANNTQLQDDIECILSNLRNAKKVWGEDSFNYKTSKTMAEDYLFRTQANPDPNKPQLNSDPSISKQIDDELVKKLASLALSSSETPKK